MIYQFTKKNTTILSFKNYNTNLTEFGKYPIHSVKAGEEGVVLVKFIIAPNGQVDEYKILRGVSKEIDQQVVAMINSHYPKLEFRKGNNGKENIYQEVVVPFNFNLQRPSVNRYYYHHPVFIQQIHHTPMGPIRVQTMRF